MKDFAQIRKADNVIASMAQLPDANKQELQRAYAKTYQLCWLVSEELAVATPEGEKRIDLLANAISWESVRVHQGAKQ